MYALKKYICNSKYWNAVVRRNITLESNEKIFCFSVTYWLLIIKYFHECNFSLFSLSIYYFFLSFEKTKFSLFVQKS